MTGIFRLLNEAASLQRGRWTLKTGNLTDPLRPDEAVASFCSAIHIAGDR